MSLLASLRDRRPGDRDPRVEDRGEPRGELGQLPPGDDVARVGGDMSIEFACEVCDKPFKVDASHAGRRGRCKRCGHVMTIPAAAEAEVGDGLRLEPARPEPALAPAVGLRARMLRRVTRAEPDIELKPIEPEDDPRQKAHFTPEVAQALLED